MKIERTKNAARNIIFGMIQKLYGIALPFLMRTILIHGMGAEYLGLNSLFTAILQVLNLAELGVGSAMIYSMYRPIIEDDTETICALLSLYRKYYRVIGAVIGIIGISFMPFLPYMVKTETIPPELNLYALYSIYLAGVVISYWLYAYKMALLQAHQRMDVISKITMFSTTITSVLQIIMLLVFRNYYLYTICYVSLNIFNNIFGCICAGKMYPTYQPYGKIDDSIVKKMNQKVRDLFVVKLGSLAVNTADTLTISAFLGLKVLAIFQNYMYIIRAILEIVSIFFTSCIAGIGNSILTESKDKNYKDLRLFTFLIAWIANIGCNCFLNGLQPFMELWVGEKYLLDFPIILCFCLYFFIFVINQLLNTYKDAAGLWKEDKSRVVVTVFCNLSLNILLVQKIGVYGVLFCTILSTAGIGMPWLLYNLFRTVFHVKHLLSYIWTLGGYAASTIICCGISFYCCSKIKISGVEGLIGKLFLCLILSNLYYLIRYMHSAEWKAAKVLCKRVCQFSR